MTVHEYCLIHDQPVDWCKNQDTCRQVTNAMVVAPYLTGWEKATRLDATVFLRGDFVIQLIGKHDIRLIGKGFSGEMRFYDAAKKVMEIEHEM